ncbi:MAG: SGNH/GDSL hydrolase family protein [Actinomycetota bacterium]
MRTARTKTTATIRSLAAGCLALLFLLASCEGGATEALRSVPASSAAGGGTASYLALGDSLAVGYQPGRGETAKGYVDDLWRSIRQQIPGLSLRNVGCAGETSRSMITGKHSLCRYAAGSQLDAAVRFLERHPDEVSFITIDIGANDVVGRCLDFDTGLIDQGCVVDLLPRLNTRITGILDALRAAAGPGVPIVGMTYYVPFLGFWGLVPGGHRLARADLRAFEVLNDGLAATYEVAGATVADVAGTFRIDDFTQTVVVEDRGRLPVNVTRACRWTWFCSERHFGDPHANRKGYARIAHTFNRVLQTLLP